MGGTESDNVLRAAHNGTETGESTRWRGEQCGARQRRTQRRAEAQPRAKCRDGAQRCRHSEIKFRASHSWKTAERGIREALPGANGRAQERRGDGPDRPKIKRVDGSVCYENSGSATHWAGQRKGQGQGKASGVRPPAPLT